MYLYLCRRHPLAVFRIRITRIISERSCGEVLRRKPSVSVIRIVKRSRSIIAKIQPRESTLRVVGIRIAYITLGIIRSNPIIELLIYRPQISLIIIRVIRSVREVKGGVSPESPKNSGSKIRTVLYLKSELQFRVSHLISNFSSTQIVVIDKPNN